MSRRWHNQPASEPSIQPLLFFITVQIERLYINTHSYDMYSYLLYYSFLYFCYCIQVFFFLSLFFSFLTFHLKNRINNNKRERKKCSFKAKSMHFIEISIARNDSLNMFDM